VSVCLLVLLAVVGIPLAVWFLNATAAVDEATAKAEAASKAVCQNASARALSHGPEGVYCGSWGSVFGRLDIRHVYEPAASDVNLTMRGSFDRGPCVSSYSYSYDASAERGTLTMSGSCVGHYDDTGSGATAEEQPTEVEGHDVSGSYELVFYNPSCDVILIEYHNVPVLNQFSVLLEPANDTKSDSRCRRVY